MKTFDFSELFECRELPDIFGQRLISLALLESPFKKDSARGKTRGVAPRLNVLFQRLRCSCHCRWGSGVHTTQRDDSPARDYSESNREKNLFSPVYGMNLFLLTIFIEYVACHVGNGVQYPPAFFRLFLTFGSTFILFRI